MPDSHALTLIQDEKFQDYNAYADARGGKVDLSNAHLRAYDLRKCKLANANLAGAYLRAADLRSVDLSLANLEGASLKEAKVSGTLFPPNLTPEEIRLSLEYGTRLRVTPQ